MPWLGIVPLADEDCFWLEATTWLITFGPKRAKSCDIWDWLSKEKGRKEFLLGGFLTLGRRERSNEASRTCEAFVTRTRWLERLRSAAAYASSRRKRDHLHKTQRRSVQERRPIPGKGNAAAQKLGTFSGRNDRSLDNFGSVHSFSFERFPSVVELDWERVTKLKGETSKKDISSNLLPLEN